MRALVCVALSCAGQACQPASTAAPARETLPAIADPSARPAAAKAPPTATPPEPSSSATAPPADADAIAGWGESKWCTGLATDVRPPACSDPTGCYKLSLMDAKLDVVMVTGKGLDRATATHHYQEPFVTSSSNELRGCFAYELQRGRPPTGLVLVTLEGDANGCPKPGAKIAERSVGTKTAECVRDLLARYPLPGVKGKVTVDVEVTVTGL